MSDETARPTPPRKLTWTKKVSGYLKLAGDVASIVMDLRDKPSGKDWLSLSIRAANLGVSWYAEQRKLSPTIDAWEYFTDKRGWCGFPSEYSKLVVAGARDLEVADEYLHVDVKLPYAVLGTVGAEQVGWVIENGQLIDGPYYQIDRQAETFVALGNLAWKMLGGRHLLFSPSGLILDAVGLDDTIIPTQQMNDLLDRVSLFLKANEPRGYLLGGAPGTGKSVAIRWLTRVLGMSSVRIDLRMFDEDGRRAGSVIFSVDSMLQILRPDVVIFDDLDRVTVNAQVLAMLERVRSACRVVIASANSVSALSGAASRPGRFDDIMRFDTPDRDVIAKMLGDHADLVDEVADLPAAYVAEFASRCRVLGRQQAIADLTTLRERAAETSEDCDD